MSSAFSYAGAWRVTRRIVPFDGGPVWTFTGQAEVGEHDFVEDGRMTAGETTLPARRRYVLDRSQTGEVVVHKGDGGPFVTLGPAPVQVVDHACGSDRYQGRLLFLDARHWIEIWRVHGPRKNYRSLAHFTRA